MLSWDNSPKPRIFDPLVYSYNRIKIIISINFTVICGDIFLFQIPKYLTILLAPLKKKSLKLKECKIQPNYLKNKKFLAKVNHKTPKISTNCLVSTLKGLLELQPVKI